MSSNNQLIIIKKNKVFEIHLNPCVDNDFKPSKETLLIKYNYLKAAHKFAQEYEKENMVEYGIYISPTCWEK